MRHARTYKPIKRDKPALGLIAIIPIAMLSFGGIAYGINLVSDKLTTNITQQVVPETQSVQPVVQQSIPPVVKDSLLSQFIDNVKSFIPQGITNNYVKQQGSANSIFSWACSIKSIPAPVESVEINLDNGSSVIIQAFAAGQSGVAFDSYQQSIKKCKKSDISVKVDSNSEFVQSIPHGFTAHLKSVSSEYFANVWSRGDVIVTVTSNDINIANSISSQYDSFIMQALQDTQCVSTDIVSAYEAQRSPYYDINQYVGLTVNREVQLDNHVAFLYPGILSTTQQVSGSGNRMGTLPPGMMTVPTEIPTLNTSVATPEAPFEPSVLPTEIPAPGNIVSAPVVPQKSVNISEKVKDDQGPGCGWLWSGQVAPAYDATLEKQRVDQEAASQQKILQSNYITYINGLTQYIDAAKVYAYQENQYIAYVNQMNQIYSQWDTLNKERSKYRKALDEYYALVSAKNSFINEQKKALEEFNNQLLACHSNTDLIPSPAPTATPTAPAPTPTIQPSATPTTQVLICPPVRPEILDQAIPEDPVVPEKPDIPLPSSWTDIPE